MAVGALLQPEDAVIVGHGSDDVVAAVAVHVVGVNETGVAEVEIGMPLPRAGARVGRGFEPTLGSDDVVAAIAVHHASGMLVSPNSGSTSWALPSLSRSTRKANSTGEPVSIMCSFHSPVRGPGFSLQKSRCANQEQLTISTRPSPLTSSGRSLKLSM